MRQEKRLQKKFKKEFETPDVPFEEWAEQRGVFAELERPAAEPVLEFADNVEGRGMGNRKKILMIGAPLLALLVVLAVLLAVFLPRSESPQIFGANDTEKVKIELEEVTAQKDIYLFDLSEVIKRDSVYKEILIKDETQVMLYTLEKCLLSVKNGESTDAFYLTYCIKIYPHYEIYNAGRYLGLNKNTNVLNKSIQYKIVEDNIPVAYAKFSDGKYEYFIEAKGYQDITVLNESNFLNLLNQILI